MAIFEQPGVPMMNIERPLRGSGPCCPCWLQEVTVYNGGGNAANGGQVIGQIVQRYTCVGSEFDVVVGGAVHFKIAGPLCICDGPCCGDQVFHVQTPQGMPIAAGRGQV